MSCRTGAIHNKGRGLLGWAYSPCFQGGFPRPTADSDRTAHPSLAPCGTLLSASHAMCEAWHSKWFRMHSGTVQLVSTETKFEAAHMERLLLRSGMFVWRRRFSATPWSFSTRETDVASSFSTPKPFLFTTREALGIWGHAGHLHHSDPERSRWIDRPRKGTRVDYANGAWFLATRFCWLKATGEFSNLWPQTGRFPIWSLTKLFKSSCEFVQPTHGTKNPTWGKPLDVSGFPKGGAIVTCDRWLAGRSVAWITCVFGCLLFTYTSLSDSLQCCQSIT